MPPGTPCPCLLCSTEADLLKVVKLAEADIVDELFSRCPHLRSFSSTSSLLRYLRSVPPDAEVDELIGELCTLRKVHPDLIESLLVLAFLPMLHITIRRVTAVQAALAAEDVTQQTLSFFLQYLSSADLDARTSHFAFAISRAVKRKTFEWAYRQSVIEDFETKKDFGISALVVSEETIERHAALRHFLHKTLATKALTNNELDLLIEFKLEGNGGSDFEASGRGNSNMLRQRLKRLLAKLRRIANNDGTSRPPKPQASATEILGQKSSDTLFLRKAE
jgi:hypothetical protein